MVDKATTDRRPLKNDSLTFQQAIDDTVASGSKSSAARPQLYRTLLYGITTASSLIPPYLVVRDRWWGQPLEMEFVNKVWWGSPILESLEYPPYFLLVFFFTLIAALGAFFGISHHEPIRRDLHPRAPSDVSPFRWKKLTTGNYILIAAILIVNVSMFLMVFKGRLPSWDVLLALTLFLIGLIALESVSFSWREFVKTHGQRYLDAILLVIALCCALYAAFGEAKSNLIFYVLLLAAALNFLRHRRQAHVLFWISLASLTALTWNLNDWHYAAIGDEYSFFTAIRDVLDHRSAAELVSTAFNGSLVYGSHPYLSSYIQDFFMKLFGNHNFGWRFSNPVLVAVSLPLFYYFFKAFVDRQIAILAVICLGFSHYLLSFSKIAYNNLQAFFALGLVLACFTWALRSGRMIAFCITGLSMGLCFYLFPAALYILPLPVIGLLVFMPPTNRESAKRWFWMMASASFLVYPLLIQTAYWETKILGTFLSTELVASSQLLRMNILHNALYSAFSYLYIPEQSHFVSIGYLDFLSGAFLPAGFMVLLKSGLQRNKPALFLLLSFLAMFFIAGTTHGREFPTTTRMFMLLPWLTLFTAFGLNWFLEQAGHAFRIRINRLGYLFAGLIVVLNLYQAYVLDIRNMADYHTLGPMFIKTVREINAESGIAPKSYAFVTTADWNAEGLRMLQRVYLVPESARQLINIPMEGEKLPGNAQELVSQRDAIVIVRADMEPGLIQQVDEQLQGWGKSMCEIKNSEGTLQFQLWHSGDLDWLCRG